MIGQEVGPYRFLEEIGQGGMGIMYKAVHTQLEQEVAIKVLRPEYALDPSMRRRFIAEAKLQAKLSHPHVVNIFNYVEDAGHMCLVMEHIKGPTLEQRLAAMGRIPQREAVAICRDVLAALGFMHSRGIIHRDIKPANIMFTDTGMVKVTDFGIAKLTREKGQTRTSMPIGTLCYMSPEQIQGKPASVASDLYALGITLYQMVTGDLPFKGESEYTIMRAHIEEMPAPPWAIDPHISAQLGQVILKALQKEPQRRYPGADDFSEALASVAPQPSMAEPAVRSASRPRSRGRSALQPKTRACLTVVAAFSVVLALWLSPGFYNGSVRPAVPAVAISADSAPSTLKQVSIAESDRLPPSPPPPASFPSEPVEEPVAVERSTAPEVPPPDISLERIQVAESEKAAPSRHEPPEEAPHVGSEPEQEEPSQEPRPAMRAARQSLSPATASGPLASRPAPTSQQRSSAGVQKDSGGWYIKK